MAHSVGLALSSPSLSGHDCPSPSSSRRGGPSSLSYIVVTVSGTLSSVGVALA